MGQSAPTIGGLKGGHITTYGFTGSRYLNPLHHHLIDEVLTAHLDGDLYVTGGAVGVDTYVLRKMAAWRFDAQHHVYLPEHGPDWDNPYLELADGVTRVPDTLGHPHRSRNTAIVKAADLLLAFPLHAEEGSKRSGTWMTINIARKLGTEMVITLLDRA